MPNQKLKQFRLTLHIAMRFLFAKKRAMLMSLAGIVFGVAFFIVTQAQTSGFEDFFIRVVWGTRGAIRVQDQYQSNVTTMIAHGADSAAGFEIPLEEGRTYVDGVQLEKQVTRALWEFSQVTGVAGVLRDRVRISSGFRTFDGEVLGVRMQDYITVSDINTQLKFGSLESFDTDPGSILIGSKMAERLFLDIGSQVRLQGVGESRRYRVVGIFETGVEEFDKRRVFVPLDDARRLLQKPTGVSFLQVTLLDNNEASRIADHIEGSIKHAVVSWQESERTWLEVFRVLRISSGITMSVIILIAGLGMFNTLAIIVMERRREIAILRSMGYSRQDVVLIFVNQGLIVLVTGTVLGCIMAALLTLGIESLPIRIRGIFSTDNFIVKWSFLHYLWAIIVATVVVMVASYIPARRAARIEPGQIIRGTGG